MPQQIPATAEHERRARALNETAPASLRTPEITRLRVLMLLMEQLPNAAIAQQLKITSQRVSQIRGEAIENGLDIELARIEQRFKKRADAGRKHSHAGRLGRATWELHEQSPDIAGERYVEVATLVFTTCLQAAVIVTGRLAKQMPDEPEHVIGKGQADRDFQKRVKKIAMGVAGRGTFEHPPWTRLSVFDDICSELFKTMEAQFGDISRSTLGIEWLEEQNISPLRQRFPSAGKAIVLWAGDSLPIEFLDGVFPKSREYDDYHIDQPGDFSRALASFVFECRNSLTGLGTLPCVYKMLDAVNRLEEESAPGLLWEPSEEMVEDWIRRRFAVRDLYALKGVLMEHNATLARKISVQDKASFRTFSNLTRVEVEKESPDTGTVVLSVEPLPEFRYFVECTTGRSGPQIVAKALREVLRKPNASATRRLVYAPGPLALDAAMPGQSSIEHWLGGSKDEAAPRHLTLLPRHFLRADSSPRLEGLTWKPNALTVAEIARKEGTERVAILDASSLRDSLWRAFQENRIGDHVAGLIEWSGRVGGNALFRQKGDQFGWMASSLVFGNNVPQFWWLPPQGLAGCSDVAMRKRLESSISAAVKAVLEAQNPEAFAGLAHGQAILDMIEAFNRSKTSQERADAVLQSDSEFRVKEAAFYNNSFTEPIVVPINNESTFLTALTELDADYLLSHVPDSERAAFDPLVDDWAAHCSEWVAREFWPGTKLNLPRLKTMLPAAVREVIRDSDADEIASQALSDFQLGRRRVIRWAVETAQRRILAGKSAAFVFAESESEIFRTWRAYVGKYSLRSLSTRKNASLEEFVRFEDPGSDEPEQDW